MEPLFMIFLLIVKYYAWRFHNARFLMKEGNFVIN